MGTPAETLPGLFYGYLVVWGLIALYVIYLGIRCSKMEKKLTSGATSDTE